MNDPNAVSTHLSLSEAVLLLKRMHVEDILLPVLIQLVVIIVVARVFAVLFRKLGQPSVVGEIAAGLMLGPSVLGYILPGLSNAVFHPVPHGGLPPELFDVTLHWVFSMLSQLGLILLLFLIGLEFDFTHLRDHGTATVAISTAGIMLPFALGIGVAWLLHPYIEAHPNANSKLQFLGFSLFLGTAMSITALPVLGRMMMELNITRTRIGTITISSAAINDAAGWTLLATVSAIVRGGFDPTSTLRMVGLTIAFGLCMVFVVKPLLVRWVRRALKHGNGELGLNSLAILLAAIFGCAIVANLIGIFAIFGAFLLGAVLSSEPEFREAVSRRLRDLVTAFFLPIFFTYTGLQTDIGSLGGRPMMWLLCGLVLAAASVGKFAGCGLAAWSSGFRGREATVIGCMMNTRGLMELIVVNVGYQLRVIPPSVFCMLVIMALTTTIMTTPILLRLARGTELEPFIRESGFRAQ
ncbi:MAG: cation:proton antiporter [Planctomycetales bacterium]|nr:cation:proton antiporter [Planctomycetales bacterium]